MRYSSLARLLAATLLVAGAAPSAHAQQPARVATRVDSLRAARDGKPTFAPVVFTLVNGKQMRGYVTSYDLFMTDKVLCYQAPPDQLPPPPVKELSIERLKTMQVEGHTLDALTINSKPLKMLAENMAPAGASKIYGYFITKANMYIPIPSPTFTALIPVGSHDKYFWYVRPAGGELQEVPRSDKGFARLMAVAFADYPALATRVRQQAPDAGFKNMPALVREYQAHFTAK